MDDMTNEEFEELMAPHTKEEAIEQMAAEITNKIMVFAIDNHLLDKSADEIIEAYKKSVEHIGEINI